VDAAEKKRGLEDSRKGEEEGRVLFLRSAQEIVLFKYLIRFQYY